MTEIGIDAELSPGYSTHERNERNLQCFLKKILFSEVSQRFSGEELIERTKVGET